MTRGRWRPAAGIGIVLVTGSVLGALAVASTSSSGHNARLADDADALVDRVVTILERDVAEMERLAVVAPTAADLLRAAPARLELVDELVAVAHATRRGSSLVIDALTPGAVGTLREGADLGQIPGASIVHDRVVTEADATAGAPFTDDDGDGYVLVAAPTLDDSTAPEVSRRASVTGAILGAVRGDDLLRTWDGDARLVAPNGLAIGDARGDLYAGTVDIRGRAWTLLLDAPGAAWPRLAWLVLAGGIAVSVAAAFALDVQVTRRRNAEAQARARSVQLERIAEAGARLQESLDLSQLLPAFAVALAEDFDLSSVVVMLVDDDGNLHETFSSGEPSERAPLELRLQRGWRTVGALRLQPQRLLDAAEMTSLQALADLLAVALSNAQLYEREQLNAARLRDLDALKNAFLGTVSHELRTSMTAIMGFGELLSDSWDNLDDVRRREMANRIRRSAGSLRHLVDDLLDFARLEQERLRVSLRAVDLAGIIRQTIDGLAPLLGNHQLDLRLPPSLPAWADSVAVERILANLVSNATKYSPPGSTVTVSAEAVGDVARLVVSDQGPGIPPEERRRIFVRFYRLDTPESVRTRGAGIGLAILRDFADRSGASVTVDDAPGGGARFTVDFPTRPIEAPGADEEMAVAT
jgi:signal transduction histidine kinase